MSGDESTKIGGVDYIPTEPDDDQSSTPQVESVEDNVVVKKKPGRKPGRKPRTAIPNTNELPKTPVVGKTKRKPVGLRRPTTNPGDVRPGYRRRRVLDVEDRIQMFQEGGYSIVMGEDGAPRSRRAGNGRRTILMEIPEAIYDEDQQAKYREWNKDAQERLKPREGKGFYQPKS